MSSFATYTTPYPMNKIDTSSPRRFKDSLLAASSGIADSDFRSMHDHGMATANNSSGRWGDVVICVGVAQKDGVVAVRNTNDPDKTTALFTNEEWKVFVDGVKAGKFD